MKLISVSLSNYLSSSAGKKQLHQRNCRHQEDEFFWEAVERGELLLPYLHVLKHGILLNGCNPTLSYEPWPCPAASFVTQLIKISCGSTVGKPFACRVCTCVCMYVCMYAYAMLLNSRYVLLEKCSQLQTKLSINWLVLIQTRLYKFLAFAC